MLLREQSRLINPMQEIEGMEELPPRSLPTFETRRMINIGEASFCQHARILPPVAADAPRNRFGLARGLLRQTISSSRASQSIARGR